MAGTTINAEAESDLASFLPVLLLLFFGSGCAALIYEIVWFQMLQLVIGSTSVSVGVLLSAFMGGMFLGSLALPRYVSTDRHPLRVYATLEFAIAALAALLLVLIPLLGSAYIRVVPSGLASVLFRASLAGLLLIPPTVLMGATLPAISRCLTPCRRGVAWMGWFYAGNIAGAVCGCLLAGFYLLRQFDIVVATFVAVFINIAVAILALVLSRHGAYRVPAAAAKKSAPVCASRHRWVLIAIALSGFTALAAEVVWTRLMALMLGATTYTFSIILAVFLAALAVGSAAGSYQVRTAQNPRLVFALCQVGVVLGIAWTAWVIAVQLPHWSINPAMAGGVVRLFQYDLARTVWALAPAPLFWGASFPLAVAAVADRGQDPGKLLGGVYACNTAGAILGALAFGVVLIPWFGTQNAQRLLLVLAAVTAVVLVLPWLRGPQRARTAVLAGVSVLLMVVAMLVALLPPIPPVLVAYGRYAPTYDAPNTLYFGEGRNSSIVVTELDNGVRNLHIGGKVVASTAPQDLQVLGMLGHLSALLHEQPKSVLIVGFGTGVTAGTFTAYPGIERILICEIEPLIIEASSAYFSEVNNKLLSDPRVEVIYDDARHFLLTTDETFDLITSDPIHPWMKGAAALFSREYFDLARSHLNPGGVITQWVPLYESNMAAVKSEIVTFFQTFPEATVWGNTHDGEGYDLVLAAKNGELKVDVDRFVQRLQSVEYGQVVRSLSQAGFPQAIDLLTTYAAGADDLAPWLETAVVNRDRNLRLMYLAGIGLNEFMAGDIYAELLAHRRFPDKLFTGSIETLRLLRDNLRF